MSYLVDALKKAERERHQRQTASMESLSASESPSHPRTGNRMMYWFVTLLVAGNVALAGYLFGPGTGRVVAGGASPETAKSASVSAKASDLSSSVAPPARAATANTAPAEANERADASDPSRVRSPSDRPSSQRLSDQAPRPGAQRRGGQLTYAQTQLMQSPPGPATISDANRQPRMPQSAGARPQVHINGHLYSSVPGRSFILVNGRRYHEGERLAAGPAVESIDVAGATLNYRGQRYHIEGPG